MFLRPKTSDVDTKIKTSSGVFVFLLFLFLPIISFSQLPVIPNLEFKTMNWFDNYFCPPKSKAKIDPIWKNEGEKRIPELESAWNEGGKYLIRVTQNLIGKVFGFEKKSVNLFYCPQWPAWNFPLMIPLSPYLKTASGDLQLPDEDFVDQVFHQLLHPYILKLLPWNQLPPMTERYINEPFTTLFHIHLYAIQKQVYTELNQPEMWQRVLKKNLEYGAGYKRAIQIVEEDGTQPFIQELKKY